MSLVETRQHASDIIELCLARPPVNALDPALCTSLAEAVRAAVASASP